MKEDHTKKWSAQRLYDSAKEARQAGDYETAIDYYQKLESRYPFGPYAQQAQLDLIYTYYKYDEPASALAARIASSSCIHGIRTSITSIILRV